MINVLWLEDNAVTLRDFFNLAKQENVNLLLQETAEDAKTMIELHPEQIDAAILDARGYRHSASEQAGTGGMHEVRRLLETKQIPFAIFSGEALTINNEEFINAIGNAEVFEKGKDEMAVLNHIKNVVKDLPNVKAKQENALAFSVFADSRVIEMFGKDKIFANEQTLIKLIRNREDVDVVAKCIRSLYESLVFPLFEAFRVIDSNNIYGERNSFNYKAVALEHRDTEYIGKDYIGKMACMLALFSQPLNHGKLETSAGVYLNSSGNKYYLSCLVEGMLAVMSWLPDFLKNNTQV